MEDKETKKNLTYEEAWRKFNAMKQRKYDLVANLEAKLKEEYEREGKPFPGLEVW